MLSYMHAHALVFSNSCTRTSTQSYLLSIKHNVCTCIVHVAATCTITPVLTCRCDLIVMHAMLAVHFAHRRDSMFAGLEYRQLSFASTFPLLLTALHARHTSPLGACRSSGGQIDIWQCISVGNLLVLRDGRLGFIDFGIVGKISPVTFQALEAFLMSTMTADYDTMARALVTMGVTKEVVVIEVRPVHCCGLVVEGRHTSATFGRMCSSRALLRKQT